MSKCALDSSLLVERFNRKDSLAFSQVYSILYDELHNFAARIYSDTEVSASDVVHDVFVRLWQSKMQFEGMINIKAYIYISIKNSLRNYIAHTKCQDNYKKSIVEDDDLYVVEIIESEIYSFVSQAIKALPDDCGEIIRYHLEGWNAKEIAEKVGISERSVYNKKNEAIKILKNKFENRASIDSTLID